MPTGDKLLTHYDLDTMLGHARVRPTGGRDRGHPCERAFVGKVLHISKNLLQNRWVFYLIIARQENHLGDNFGCLRIVIRKRKENAAAML